MMMRQFAVVPAYEVAIALSIGTRPLRRAYAAAKCANTASRERLSAATA